MKRRFIIVVLMLGIGFRLLIAFWQPQPFINDQRDYDWFAQKILADPHMLGSHSFRTYPYPLLLACFYRLVGFANHTAVFYLQAIMDSLTGILVYGILRYGGASKKTAAIGMIIYLCNPFTAGYVNVVLAEIMTTFFIALTIFFGVWYIRRPTWYCGILFGLSAGIGAETRNAAFLWTVLPLGLLLYFVPLRKHVIPYGAIGLGLLLTVLYPLYTNWRDFGEPNITTVDSFYAKELFNGAIIKVLPPLGPPLPQETYQMYYEYYSEYFPDRDRAYRKAIAQKYYQKTLEIIRRDPIDYLTARIYKMWYVWQKEAIYTYSEHGYDSHRWITYSTNLVLLSSSVLGVFWLFLLRHTLYNTERWLLWVIGGTLVYGSVVFSVTHAEYRLTIPFYPLLAISAAYPLATVVNALSTQIQVWRKR